MRKASDISDAVSCNDATLLFEKQIAEEKLTGSELELFSQHVDRCDECRRLAAWLRILPDVADTPSEAEVEAARAAFLESGAESPRNEEPLRWKGVLALAAAAAVLLALGLLYRVLVSKEPPPEAPLACVPAPVTSPLPGIVMTYCGDRSPETTVDKSGAVRVALFRGTVGLNIDPMRPDPHEVTVIIEEGEVRVKGTLFTVGVGENEARVEVFRGIVEFVPRSDAPSLQIAAGQGADLRRGMLLAASRPRTENLRRILEAEAGVGGGTAAQPLLTQGKAAVDDVAETAVPASEAEVQGDVLSGDDAFASSESAEKGTDPAARRPSIDMLIQNAQSCLIEYDWNCAAARYHDVLRFYAGRPEATAVLVSLAKLELRRLGEPQKALRHYKTYQQRAPRGAMAEETLFGIAEAYRSLGNRDFERQTLRQFIAQYPKSPQLDKARGRLRRLEEADSR